MMSISTPVTSLAGLLPRFGDFRVAVVGDMILDRYIFGRATRISPEAPVPVVLVERETETLGGAANVVRNILGLKGRAVACGVVGDDPRGETLATLLADAGSDCSGLIRVPGRPTTVKTRVIANQQQQLVRIDREETAVLPAEIQTRIEAHVLGLVQARAIDAIVFEDYAKGLLTQDMMQRLVDAAREQGIITVLDPHPAHPHAVRGLHLIKPNRAEALDLAGMHYSRSTGPVEMDEALLEASRRIRKEWQVKHLLITLGSGGMVLFSNGGAPLHFPTQAREVFDVSGAGDCVTATYTLALLAGASPADAARISNHAAGVVVAKIGTVPISAAELLQALHGER